MTAVEKTKQQPSGGDSNTSVRRDIGRIVARRALHQPDLRTTGNIAVKDRCSPVGTAQRRS